MDYYMWHRSFVKVEELRRYLRFWLIAERVPVSMRKTKQQWMCGDLVGKHVPEYADSRQSALQINVCQRSALEIRPESESAKSQIEVSRPYVHSKRSDRLFLFCRRPCWLLIVHCAHCPHSERFEWSQVWLGGHLAILKPRFSSLPSQTVASDLGSLSQHCKILLDLETFCPTSSFWWQTIQWLFANTKKKISKFQSFEVSKFHGQSINQLIFSGCASISKYWIGVRSRMIMKPICKKIDRLCSLQIFCIRDRQQEKLKKQRADMI